VNAHSEAGFEPLEHTADLKVRVWAPDLRGLIEQSARAMIGFMVQGTPAPTSHVVIAGTGEDAEQTLVDCLREILLLPELEGLMPVVAEVLEADERGCRCSVGVIPAAQGDERRGEDIKAVTYHDLRIREARDHLEVEIVFDV